VERITERAKEAESGLLERANRSTVLDGRTYAGSGHFWSFAQPFEQEHERLRANTTAYFRVVTDANVNVDKTFWETAQPGLIRLLLRQLPPAEIADSVAADHDQGVRVL
jgi:hypothetical protein